MNDSYMINGQNCSKLRLSATLDNGTVWFVEESRLKEVLRQCDFLDRWIALQLRKECSLAYQQDLKELQEIASDIRDMAC